MQMCKTLLYFDIPRTVSMLRILQRYQQQRLMMDDILGPKYGPQVVFWSIQQKKKVVFWNVL